MRKRRPPPLDEAQLAAAAHGILEDYRRFLASAPPGDEAGDAKAFAARHGAARSALAHLDQLLKLAGEALAGEEAGSAADCIAEARAALAEPSAEESEADGEAG